MFFCFCLNLYVCYNFFFFFQAEDGIRDYKVTGVQTCALPIWRDRLAEADDIARTTHRQEFAVAPQIAWPPRQRLLAQPFFDCLEIVAHQEWLALAGEVTKLVRRVARPGRRAFEVGDECRAFRRQVVVVAHCVLRCSSVARPPRTRRHTISAFVIRSIVSLSPRATRIRRNARAKN